MADTVETETENTMATGAWTGELALILSHAPCLPDTWRLLASQLGYDSKETKELPDSYYQCRSQSQTCGDINMNFATKPIVTEEKTALRFPVTPFIKLLNDILERWALSKEGEAVVQELVEFAETTGNKCLQSVLMERFPEPGSTKVLPQSGADLTLQENLESPPTDLLPFIETLTKQATSEEEGKKPVKILEVLPRHHGNILGSRILPFPSRVSRILHKVGDRPVAILSINGRARTGKSFLANQLAKYLRFHKEARNWLDKNLEEEFGWGAGPEEITSGIDMWAEPFILKQHSNPKEYGPHLEIAVILMDCKGMYDIGGDNNLQVDKLIFSFSALFSSFFIYNENCLDNLTLQDLHCNSELAKCFGNGNRFQNLILLLRDWDTHTYQYDYGYYDKSYKGSSKNLQDFIFPSGSKSSDSNSETENPIEAQNPRSSSPLTSSGIQDCFENVSVFAMAPPLRQRPDHNRFRQSTSWDRDFRQTLTSFVEKVCSFESLISGGIKRVSGAPITGNELIPYVERWCDSIMESKSQPKTIFQTNASLFYEKRVHKCLDEFQSFGMTKLTEKSLEALTLQLEEEKGKQCVKFDEMGIFGSRHLKNRHKLELLDRLDEKTNGLVQMYELQEAAIALEAAKSKRNEVVKNQKLHGLSPKTKTSRGLLGSSKETTKWEYDEALYQQTLEEAVKEVSERQAKYEKLCSNLGHSEKDGSRPSTYTNS